MWKVTYAIDSLDPNPMVMQFEEEYEAIDWLNDRCRVELTILFSIAHIA